MSADTTPGKVNIYIMSADTKRKLNCIIRLG